LFSTATTFGLKQSPDLHHYGYYFSLTARCEAKKSYREGFKGMTYTAWLNALYADARKWGLEYYVERKSDFFLEYYFEKGYAPALVSILEDLQRAA
jgi:hypothetical protein